MIPEDRKGVMKTEDSSTEFVRSCAPKFVENVAHYLTIKKKGDKLLGPNTTKAEWLAFFLVVGRGVKGRQNCLRLAEQIRKKFRYELEETINDD
jgi:hypothetical protein